MEIKQYQLLKIDDNYGISYAIFNKEHTDEDGVRQYKAWCSIHPDYPDTNYFFPDELGVFESDKEKDIALDLIKETYGETNKYVELCIKNRYS